jgi:hypothetical protein
MCMLLKMCRWLVVLSTICFLPTNAYCQISVVLNPRECVSLTETKIDLCPAVVDSICPGNACIPGNAGGFVDICLNNDDMDGNFNDPHTDSIYGLNYEGTVAGAAVGTDRQANNATFVECYRQKVCHCRFNLFGQRVCITGTDYVIYGNVFWTPSEVPCPIGPGGP